MYNMLHMFVHKKAFSRIITGVKSVFPVCDFPILQCVLHCNVAQTLYAVRRLLMME